MGQSEFFVADTVRVVFLAVVLAMTFLRRRGREPDRRPHRMGDIGRAELRDTRLPDVPRPSRWTPVCSPPEKAGSSVPARRPFRRDPDAARYLASVGGAYQIGEE